MQKIIIYQEKKRFCMTRARDVRKLDAEELLRELHNSREQLKETQEQLDEFKRDIVEMEKFEALAKTIREDEIAQAKVDRK